MTTFKSQSARDAQRMNYGDEDYWQYLEDAAIEGQEKWSERLGINFMTRTLSESLMGNEGD